MNKTSINKMQFHCECDAVAIMTASTCVVMLGAQHVLRP